MNFYELILKIISSFIIMSNLTLASIPINATDILLFKAFLWISLFKNTFVWSGPIFLRLFYIWVFLLNLKINLLNFWRKSILSIFQLKNLNQFLNKWCINFQDRKISTGMIHTKAPSSKKIKNNKISIKLTGKNQQWLKLLCKFGEK